MAGEGLLLALRDVGDLIERGINNYTGAAVDEMSRQTDAIKEHTAAMEDIARALHKIAEAMEKKPE